MDESTALLRVVVRRTFAGDDLADLPLHLELAVLNRYRGALGYSLIRSNTVGRVKKEGGWSVDIGIAPEDALIHVLASDLLRLPAEEREH